MKMPRKKTLSSTEIKKLIEEKRQIDEEFSGERKKLGMATIEKDFMRKKKEINDEINRNELQISLFSTTILCVNQKNKR